MMRIALFLGGATALVLLASTTIPAAQKVMICHVPVGNPANAITIAVGPDAVPAHLAHGDTLGPCGAGHLVTICHIPRGAPAGASTLVVSTNALPAHLRHGDVLGPCPP